MSLCLSTNYKAENELLSGTSSPSNTLCGVRPPLCCFIFYSCEVLVMHCKLLSTMVRLESHRKKVWPREFDERAIKVHAFLRKFIKILILRNRDWVFQKCEIRVYICRPCLARRWGFDEVGKRSAVLKEHNEQLNDFAIVKLAHSL